MKKFTTSFQADVLIVGYGPVGAAMACFLGKFGINTLVIDKGLHIAQMPRAIALDNEALRILQNAGLEEDAFETRTITEVLMHSPYAGLFGRADTLGAVDGQPKLVTFYQPDLESALRNKAAQYPNVRIMEQVELISLEENASGVHAEVRLADGSLGLVETRQVVGADGANSLVRRLIGQAFEGKTYGEDWLIVDVNKRNNQTMRFVEFVCNPALPMPHMPAPGGRERWEFKLKPGQCKDTVVQDEFILKLIKPWINEEDISIERRAVYRFHARCASAFSKSRIHLVGDAAHITPPFVGQGLVAGLRDVSNLSWKLAAVVSGLMPTKLLESYDIERRPHAQEMIKLAKMMGSMVMPSGRLKALLVHGTMRLTRLWNRSRRFMEDLEIKPKHEFKRGAFLQKWSDSCTGLRSGGLFTQFLVRSTNGEIKWSDFWVGEQFTVLGIGVDPRSYMLGISQDQLKRFNPSFICLTPRGVRDQPHSEMMPYPTKVLEDMTGQMLSVMKQGGRIALIRPDRIVMGQCKPQQFAAMMNDCFKHLSLNVHELNIENIPNFDTKCYSMEKTNP